MDNKTFGGGLHQPMDARQLEEAVTAIIKRSGLAKEEHPFFLSAAACRRAEDGGVGLAAAFDVARHWEAMTKAFMFTTLSSLGRLSEELARCEHPSAEVLTAFQTGVKVISDDLNNEHPAFAKVAPAGPTGIHYKWWRRDITEPLAERLSLESWAHLPLSENVERLIRGMEKLAGEPAGFAIQLRVVEAIALHIAVSFQNIFLNATHDGEKLFEGAGSLAWITSHIRAEVTHHSQVSDADNGMTALATTAQEQRYFLETTEWYADLWSKALRDHHAFLDCSSASVAELPAKGRK